MTRVLIAQAASSKTGMLQSANEVDDGWEGMIPPVHGANAGRVRRAVLKVRTLRLR